MRRMMGAALFFAGVAAKPANQLEAVTPSSLMFFQDSALEPLVCYTDHFNHTKLDHSSPFLAWAPSWPTTTAELIKDQECFCETALTENQILTTRLAIQGHIQLSEYDALFIYFAHLFEREQIKPEEAPQRIKKYCDGRLAFFRNSVFSPSKALDYILNWAVRHGLWDSIRPLFEQGMKNFHADLNKWLAWSEQMKLPMVNAFVHYLQNNYNLRTANDALQASTSATRLDQLPVRLEIDNCIAAAPRHTYFKPYFTSPLMPWIRFPEAHIMETLKQHQGVVCRKDFSKYEDFAAAAIWDTRELQLAVLEIMIATSTQITQNDAKLSDFSPRLIVAKRLAEDQHFSLHPSEALDYTLGLLHARNHLTPGTQKLLLKMMSNYGSLNDWFALAEQLNWHFVKALVRPHIKQTKSSASGLFAEQKNPAYVVGGASLVRPPQASAS